MTDEQKTVFILSVGYDVADFDICGVYSSRQLAEESLDRDLPHHAKNRGHYNGPHIAAFVLDAPATDSWSKPQ